MTRSLQLLAFAFTVCACSRETQRAPTTTTSASTVVVVAPPVDADAAIRAKLDVWNAALARRDAKAASPLYAEHVLYFGKHVGVAERDKLLEGFFAKNADYTQALHDVHVERVDAGNAVTLRFVKAATVQGKTKDYPSYLVLDDAGRIIEESDTITDANLRKMAASHATPSEDPPTDCSSALGHIDQWVIKHLHVDMSANTFDEEFLDSGGRDCSEIHRMSLQDPVLGGMAPRMSSWCIDTSGATTATGGWNMLDSVDHEQPIDVPAHLRADVKRLCAAGMPPPKP